MDSTKPSRWHRWGQIHIWKNGHAISHKYGWVLNTTNRDIPTTKTAHIDHKHYCVYCGDKAIAIQGNYDDHMNNIGYEITGYTCDCEGARAEREYIVEHAELKAKLEKEMKEKLGAVYFKYTQNMNINKEKLLEIKAAADARRSEYSAEKLFNITKGSLQ